ncbi:2',3'-cyclic-nucleotide 2'-phosphodiesterase/5'- or 3'-nucleotidase, 5'-nucleotidase family [Cyclonatronum proteinivorum]|uniref:2',3'-cyclic-nucleotide 2'-phosphodiesterase/5'-or 3'-nucleotidase, 5'-nucleotidase family n=1 Tax=Cyclonatronum proteinivorum TaxID=1457365 RepID=A0A345UHW9_9BACT|nr:metallophosphoesterase [Cyclonatronum proteinivorum]AXJ00071.1 2',3'-cyclic-nucleotide 2'-phosphodiesterase/5'- or 3'-nucleotidase, 5'-nucleotidase family [Cyclonatronum proteinivorum]
MDKTKIMSRSRFLQLSATGFLGMLSLSACLKPNFDDEDNNQQMRVICLADLHSSHRHFPRILNFVSQLHQQSGERQLILINGDIFETSNKVASRSKGALEWYFLERLSKHAQVVVNLGNHEGGLENDFSRVVERMRRLDIAVVSNIRNKADGSNLASTAITVTQNNQLLRIIGLSCSNPDTYQPIHRNTWHFPEPSQYLNEKLGSLLHNGAVHIVMNHDGFIADNEVLDKMPAGSVVLGGHDHLRAHLQTDSWLALHTAWGGHLCDIIEMSPRDGTNPRSYKITTVEFDDHIGEDTEMGQMIKTQEARHLNSTESATAGSFLQHTTPHAFISNTVNWFRRAAGTDAAFINNTTFGPVLPFGKVRFYDIDNTIRFDSSLFKAEVRGSQLKQIIKRANQFSNHKWEERTGEFVVGAFPNTIDPFKTYTIAVNDWVAKPGNQLAFLGIDGLSFEALPEELCMRNIVASRLSPSS